MRQRTLILSCVWLLALASAVAQRQTVDLSGVWKSSLGECRLPGTTDENHLGDGKHPTDVTTQLTRLYPYVGVVTYERDVDIPKEMEGRRLMLVMERTKPSKVWVDEEALGGCNSLFSPHVYWLPRMTAGRHHLKIEIDNRDEAVPSGVHGSHAWTDATQTNWNGILGRLEIVALPPSFIRRVQLYPDVEMNEVKVRMDVQVEKTGWYEVCLSRSVYEDEGGVDAVVRKRMKLDAGSHPDVELTMDMGENPHLWSEFHPNLYTMCVTLKGKASTDSVARRFGMRKFSTEGTQFAINGYRTFLRGTHDGCVFPLTGYCPTDVDVWRRLFVVAKQYGINHFRFHSYTPTEAAFTAADELGVYLHTELPMWGTIDSTTVELNNFLRAEAFGVLDFLGNHPSFMGLGLGNELWGDNEMMARWLDEFREKDPRHLYCQGSNNDLGWRGPKRRGGGSAAPAEDFYITCRVGGGEGFSTHARTSFSFADAEHGGILNWNRPTTRGNFSHVVSLCQVPIVSHETCQFQIYPDYKEIPKYTGVLYPYNLEIFRDRLKENGLTGLVEPFHEATGKWSVDCYKADMEYCMRTPGFGGFQLLDIKDYPGQGSALCGILDAFMDSKGLVSAKDFRGWNAPVVPMAEMESFCWDALDTLRADVVLSNYTEEDYHKPLTWRLYSVDNEGNRTDGFWREGEIDYVDVWQGDVVKVGEMEVPLNDITKSTQLRLELQTGEYHNYYKMWVYKTTSSLTSETHSSLPLKGEGSFLWADTLDTRVLRALQQGKSVVLAPKLSSIEKQSVGGLFTPDYWNYAMFKTISENNNKPISPGTLGMLMNPDHPLFKNFPTEGRSDWQWWSIALNSRPLILNSLNKNYRPIIQTVDNVERNHKLGILMEFRVGKGKLLLATTNFEAIADYVEGKAYADAVHQYVISLDFQPELDITVEELRALLYSETKTRNIQGVKNITDYKEE
ncbi:MAG: glycoside hydrolase [Bacteroidaceae bacterium]|nr:glycoside hydrolase [Bacteroidaceae bacterium]